MRPTEAATSRPTVSASSIGPMGMPNFFAALSIAGPGTPSLQAVMASSRYGIRIRLTRKPGDGATGTGSLSIARAKASRRRSTSGASAGWRTISTNGISATGLK